MKILLNSWMREIDQAAIAGRGIPGIVLMENAAVACCDYFAEAFPLNRYSACLVLAGKGNNGGRGVTPTHEAIAIAQAAGLDLVEISPNTTPPVCKILDYGKFRSPRQKKSAEARKKQKVGRSQGNQAAGPGIDDS